MERNYDNCRENVWYLAQSIDNTLEKVGQYREGQFQDLNIKLTSFKKAAAKNTEDHPSDDLLRKISYSFSQYLTEDVYRELTIDAFFLNPDEFKQKFSIEKIMNTAQKLHFRPELYANLLYRFYYLVSNTHETAYYGFFKLYKIGKEYSALLLRGIQNNSKESDQISGLRACFEEDDPMVVINKFKEITKTNKSDGKKQVEAFHLYQADDKHITTSPECITIEFKGVEQNPCHTFMIWNTEISNRFSSMRSYIGGSVLCVDTNEGNRGKEISSYKAGLEAPRNLKKALLEKNCEFTDDNDPENYPLNLESPALINILTLESKNGAQILNNADDSLWYRFLLNPKHREKNKTVYTPEQLTEIVKKILEMEHKEQENLDRLEKLEEKLKGLIKK